jgi:predicted MPP superfamily phosphohydrolase
MDFLLPLLTAPIAIFLYAVIVGRRNFQLRRLKINLGASRPFTILHISDLHFRQGQRKKVRFLKKLASLNPDLVINTGDNLGGLNQEQNTSNAMSELLQIPGAFVFGGNDYRGPVFKNPLGYLMKPSGKKKSPELDSEKLADLFSSWANLNNNSEIIEISGQKIRLIGLDDPHEQYDNPTKLQKQIGDEEADIVIGVVHAPYHRAIQELSLRGAQLVLAGHTHGGQVCWPNGKALTTNCDLPVEYAKGKSSWIFDGQAVELHVSAGLGTSIFAPFRLFCPPEATLIEVS